ncbi:Hint domain-containing protein [Pseudoroseicyclus aestuarii]|uniref:Hint domain-containing protein n=1 Tax=Pseudoroseicyclus aestuarii TaxID=1795041 RepID=A0A318SQA1_9RHOB|nr:Hint domain-containing protein [Pseudoroseicyclus aestuarii]PYE84051.1 Hint domain-containing protein [Pseudoroseicyclus aestuarii]
MSDPDQGPRGAGATRPMPLRAVPARARPAATLMRRVDILYAPPGRPNEVEEVTRAVPAIPVFEDAVAALARGTLLPTDRGTVAVEDLLPGDGIKTVEGRFERLLWRGSTPIVPGVAGQAPGMGRLIRVSADALGIARPMPDLLLGPCARLVQRGAQGATGTLPVSEMIDGEGVIEVTPQSAVQVYNLAFARPQVVAANGVEIESHHPGTLARFPLTGETLALYLSCFPHLGGLADFGPSGLPRLRPASDGAYGTA